MRIGIVTQPLLGNYGGILQNYALQQTLIRLGHTPLTIDYVMTNSAWRYFRHSLKYKLRKLQGKLRSNEVPPTRLRVRNQVMDGFVKQHIHTTSSVTKYTSEVISRHNFEAIVVGSDQVWRPKYNDSLEDMYLKFAKDYNIKRIAYAASFGVDRWEYNAVQTTHCKALAKRFDAISVREQSGERLCSERLGVEATTVLDPTLLLDATDYGALCCDIPTPKEKFLAVYLLKSHNKQQVEANHRFVEQIAQQRGLKIKYFTADTADGISIEEWLATFRDAEMVITESFHGTVFSILNHREFITLGNASRGMARLKTLLGALGIADRLVSPQDYNPEEITPIDYTEVDKRIADLRQHSIGFLKKAISNI